MKRKGFTLIELMAVVAIIGVLLGMVMSVAANSIKISRKQKTEAICKIVTQGILTYREQKDEWPGSFTGTGSKSNTDGVNNRNNPDRLHLEPDQVRAMIKDIVEETVMKGNPLLDVSGLFVSRDPGDENGRSYGLDFRDAVHGTKESPVKMKIAEMYYGYPEENYGYFRHLNMVYSRPTDSMEVTKQ